MPIILRLDRIMADRKMSLNELSDRVGISNVNMSRIKTGKIKAIRFSTLEMICQTLNCQPGDLLEYAPRVDAGSVAVSDDADEVLEKKSEKTDTTHEDTE
ncbi:helix-turn-helix domain-containing protein [Raoultibacter phocaeensis]|uniref:helix-turn-helix domain-containing protein n=1 Tax=Raoultibacter phocaeensis TaxID=2479841 RepID=UPI001117BD09|nr:helix-turn-helix transcriptional regulator [Raoultibacter phocaeensis]